MMYRVTNMVPLRRALLLSVILAGVLCSFIGVGLASAAPQWAVSVTAVNPFGEASFQRESGADIYKVTITNVGNEPAGGQVVGKVLECEGGPTAATSIRYQWLRNGAEIAGATSKTYTVATADKERELQCETVASNGEVATAGLSSPAVVARVPSELPPSGGKPSVSGSKVGEMSTCRAQTWTPAPEQYEYQWLRNGEVIAGAGSGATTATTATYKFVSADAGKKIQCEVIATNTHGSSAAMVLAVNSVLPLGVPPTSSAAPTITGVVKAGEKLTCTNSTWAGGPVEYEYQWLRNGAPISGAKTRTIASSFEYTLQIEDEKTAVQCDVTAFSPEGNVHRVSAPTAVGTLTTAPSAAPSISLAAATVGKSVACSAGTWSPAATSYEYKWLRNGVVIPGSTTGPGSTATSVNYTPVSEDAAKALQCEIIVTNAGGSFAVGYSSPSYVAAATLIAGATATISTPATTLTNVLPKGIEASIEGGGGPTKSAPSGWSCGLVGAGRSGVQCYSASDPVFVGQSRTFEFRVFTTSAVADAADDVATVKDTSASPATTSTTYPTAITSGEFGIASLFAAVTDEFGTPFTQSTGHPFEAKARFEFKTTTFEIGVGSEVITRTAGGDPKNISVELPPGFIGAPALEEQCSVGEFLAEGSNGTSGPHPCEVNHPASSVGYIDVLTSGKVENKQVVYSSALTEGPSSVSIVTNLVPPAGSPAAFGFKISNTAFFLVARVRSDGNYGVNVISENTPDSPVVIAAAETVFCGYGAYRDVVGGFKAQTVVGCKGAAPGKSSFLSNPASCTGSAPTTTLRVDTWEHSDTYVSDTSYTGTGATVLGGEPSASESFVEGCDGFTFKPNIEVTPTASQADSPTGLAVNLKVPQENQVPALYGGERIGCLEGGWYENISISSARRLKASAYQWLEGGNEIVGETSPAYVLKNVNEARSLQCRVVAKNAGSASASISPPVERGSGGTPVPPAAGPTVSGGSKETETATCATGTWSGSPTSFAYQWLKNGAPVIGATASSYVIHTGDAPSVLQCVVTATNASGSVSAVSANKTTTPAPTDPPIIAENPEISAPSTVPGTPEVKTTVVKFPAGMSLSPSAADGLAGCSDAQFGVHSLSAAECPDASKIGTVKITTPLLKNPLEGQLFLGEPLCGASGVCSPEDATSGRMFRLFIQAIDKEEGIVVKVPGSVSVDQATGQFTASFVETPQLPFENLELQLKNGPRAPLTTPQTCGQATTTSTITPWSAPGLGGLSGTEQIEGTPDATSEESFTVDWDGKGGACPETLPFAPGFSAGTTSTTAAAKGSNALSVSLSRQDREQDLGGIVLHTPEGLLGAVSELQLCGEPQAALGTCGSASRIGSVTASAGPGTNPFSVTGSVYLTESYKGAPFGLSIVVPTKAGPFNLGNVVVRGTVAVDPHTAELTVTSNAFPQIIDGIPLRLRNVHVSVDREGFILNPSSCAAKQITATITGAPPVNNPGEPVKSSNVSSSFDVGNCANLAFNPSFAVSTQGKTSRADGASLTVNVAYPQGSEANIKYLKVELPKQLPSRLTTLQKACTDAQFEANPAGCPAASVLGTAVANTPVLSKPLTGPAYFVSHGGAAFPDLEIVLQGEGVTVVVDGATFISKQGITSTTFSTVPDAPISSFQVTLPEGPDSALAANGNLCASKLVMPTTIIAQNGKEIVQQTKIAVTGCPKAKKATLTRAQKLKAALKACRKDKSKSKRARCETQARKKYGPVKKAKKKSKKKGK